MGFEIRSRLAFSTLRHGGGSPLVVQEVPELKPTGEPVASWVARPGNPFHGRLLSDGPVYAFWASDAGWYLINPAVPSISLAPVDDLLRREIRLLGVPMALCAMELGDVSIHAASVEIDGRGVLLAGPSRAGKTTLAAGLAQAGHRLLTEDATRCTSRDTPSVFPGPSLIRLRNDVASHIHVPHSSASETDDDRVHLIIEDGSRGSGEAVPLHAIFFLRSTPDVTALRPVPTVQALRDLWALTFKLPSDASRASCFERVSDLLKGVAIFDLNRPLRVENLSEIVSLLERQTVLL